MITVNSEEMFISIPIKDTLYIDEVTKTLFNSGYWVHVDYSEDGETAIINIKEKKTSRL